MENRFVFDLVKYEIMRAELDASCDAKNRWVLWESKNKTKDLVKLGCIGGIISETVNIGSTRRGMLKAEAPSEPEYHGNYWAVSPQCVYLCGRVSLDNIEALRELGDYGIEKMDRRILFPGVTIVYLTQQ